MTSRLAVLRSQLARLRRARAGVRAAAAWSAVGSSLILGLMAIFALDFAFGLGAPDRLLAIALALAGVGWSFWRFTWPLLGPWESEIAMALSVERQQHIDSDLVAALQFELPGAENWGSAQLTGAVVDYVAIASPSIDVFRGFDGKQALRRGSLLAACLAMTLLFAVIAPAHLAALANRLGLGTAHYPTRTRIERVFVNRTAVLATDDGDARPQDCKAAEGRPLSFVLQCSGRLPPAASVMLASRAQNHRRTRVELRPLSLNERLARLQEAQQRIADALESAVGEISRPLREQLLLLISCDAPEAIAPLKAAKDVKQLQAAQAALTGAIADWPADRARTGVFAGELPRLNDDVNFRLLAGDAWTDAAEIRMIPLPIVELSVLAQPPKYAANHHEPKDQNPRQFNVLAGSAVTMSIASRNQKPLQSAWLTLQTGENAERIDFVPLDARRLEWSPAASNATLKSVRRELRYEIQVVDNDGLSLESPLHGAIRVRPDQPPAGAADVVHKVVLPTAQPVVHYRASDDYGISRVVLTVEVERSGGQSAGAAVEGRGAAAEKADNLPMEPMGNEPHSYEVVAPTEPLIGSRLPMAGSYALSLSPLKLAKGDRIKLTLEVMDYRGEDEAGRPTGQTAASESLVLEISDESGVLAAISQADERSEQQLTEIIKRQLGIGEEPK